MAHLGNTIINGTCRILNGLNVNTINGVTVGSSPKFTDTNTWRGIQNNLTSDSTTDSLSAAQGKALKSLVDGKAASGHTHGLSLATDSGTSSISLAANTKYKLTAGGSTYVFTTPPDNNTTYNFSGTTFYSGNSGTAEHNANNITKNGNYYYTSNGPATSLGASTDDGALYAQSYNDSWVGQIAQDYRNGRLFVRGKNNGTWQSWLRVYDTGNKPTPSEIGAATSGHTHGLSIATDSGTNQLTMAANTKYKLTAGGSTYIFTTPPDNNTTYTAATAAPGNISTSGAQGSSTNYARQDHTHGISLATGDSNGQVKIAGSNVSVKGLGSAAYITADTSASNGTVVQRTGSGYVFATYLNQSSGAETPTSSSYIMYANSDGYLRKSSLENIRKVVYPKLTTSTLITDQSTTKIKIKINSTIAWMLSFVVTIYQGYRSTKVMVSGYQYGSNYWYSPNAVILGDTSGSTIDVYFGYDSANNLWVGFDGNSYTGISISDVTNGYKEITNYEGLFTISNVSSLTTLQTTVSARNPYVNTWRGIQNNLTSDATDQSLSAAQGKALKSLVDGKAASGHTHGLSLAADSGTSSISLAANTKYKLTAGGSTYIFTTPPDNNTTYSSKSAASGGTDVSLVTTGEKYTWNNKSTLAIGTTSTTAAAGNHTHGLSIATDSGTAAISLTANTTYKLTAGGSTYIFKTPVDNNTTYNFSGTTFYSGNSGNAEHNANNITKNGNYYYTSNGPATSLGASTDDGALYAQSYSDSWVGQIAQDYRNGNLFIRGKNNGTWQSWKRVATVDAPIVVQSSQPGYACTWYQVLS